MKEKIIKTMFIVICIMLILPSIIYLIQNKTVLGFDTYYNFFINESANKTVSTIIYLVLFVLCMVIYLQIVKSKTIFKDIKEILKYVSIVGFLFVIMLPWTSSDVFYYMGVGELDAVYKQNPYYVTMEEYYNQNKENINDEILEQGANSFWAKTTVVYGPVAQIIFKICSAMSFKNIDVCILLFKILNLLIHILNCYLVYKITGRKKFVIIYGLNPFILLEFIGNVHNDIIVIFFILMTLYCLIKKKNIIMSVVILALGTGIKYSTILLLPTIILYYFREEPKIVKRLFNCFKYGIIFLGIILLEYLPYISDIKLFFAMMPQLSKYSKSLYSALQLINFDLMLVFKVFWICINIFIFTSLSIQILIKNKNTIFDMLRKYNTIVILSLLLLTTYQQWYLGWLFATIMWQKSNTIKDIIGLTGIVEIANSIYMFKTENYIFDIYFVTIIICLFIMWQISIRKKNKKVIKE